MSEKITMKFTDEEVESIRAKATDLAGKEVENDEWGRSEELSATEEKVKNNTSMSVAYLLKSQIRDESPDVDEWGNPVD